MTTKQRIISLLQNHPEGVDDDALAQALGLSARQQAHSLAQKITWFKPVADFVDFWVKENGQISVE